MRGIGIVLVWWGLAANVAGAADCVEVLLERQLAVLRDPVAHLRIADDARDETTEEEDRRLSTLALAFLTRNGNATTNASHVADHLAALGSPAIVKAIGRVGMSYSRLVRNALLHDLGKEWDGLPSDYRTFLGHVFPGRERFVARVVLSHEIGSMVVVEQLAAEAGIPSHKVPRLKALFARHNAGYDPRLPGHHWWIENWSAFVGPMRAQGIDVPEIYEPLPPTLRGGRAEAVVLTAIDRATSYTLASQEKFTAVLVSQRRWSNEELIVQMRDTLSETDREMRDVLVRMQSDYYEQGVGYAMLAHAIVDFFRADILTLKTLAKELGRMAKAEGTYADRPSTTAEELAQSVVYRTRKDRLWYRVTVDGDVFRGDGKAWVPVPEFSGHDAPGTFFRRILNADFDYAPRKLEAPAFLR